MVVNEPSPLGSVRSIHEGDGSLPVHELVRDVQRRWHTPGCRSRDTVVTRAFVTSLKDWPIDPSNLCECARAVFKAKA